MALTNPFQFFGTMASALNNKRQPEIIKNWSSSSCRFVLPDKTIKLTKMKKIFTLTLGLMLTVAMFAADKRPIVTVTSAKKYEIVIDGRQYSSNDNTISISTLFYGQHDIKVYKVKPGFFMGSKRLVASSNFALQNNNVQINIDRIGQIQIVESRFGHHWNDHDSRWKNDNGYGKGNDHNYGDSRGSHDKKS